MSKQSAALKSQSSTRRNIEEGITQGSTLGPLLFSVYINDLSSSLQCCVKIFVDDTFIFSVIHDSIATVNAMNEDLLKVSDWIFQ